MRFDNKVALITGAGSGLGRAYAILLAERGAKVVLIDQPIIDNRREDEPSASLACNANLIQLYEKIIKLGCDCLFYTLDVSQQPEVNRVVADIIKHWHRIDILINNAGIYGECSFEHITPAMWQRQFDVDVNGSFYLTQAVWPLMKVQEYGRIMMTTGVSALFGERLQVGYSAAKMALVGMVNSLSLEGEQYNIRVNSFCPQAVTAMTSKHLAPAIQPLFSFDAITATTAFLVSEQAPNGQHILAGADSVSHGMFTEFKSLYFSEGLCTPNKLVQCWPELYQAFPVSLYSSGEDKVLAWSKRSALEHHIEIG